MNRTSGRPKLSVVVTTRNDNHGGDLNTRTQLFLDALAAQANRHRVHTELVLVEWNPPSDRPPIEEALRWPEPSEYFEARIVVVPHELHAGLANADRLFLFQMIAKNVGIRRARGAFVLATNVDVLLSDELFEHIARSRLSERALYRVDRYDVESAVPIDVSLEEQLAWCDAHLLRICRREGIADVRDGHFYGIYEVMNVPLWWAGYMRIALHGWRRFRGITAFLVRVALAAVLGLLRAARSKCYRLYALSLAADRRIARFVAALVCGRMPTTAQVIRRYERWSARLRGAFLERIAAQERAARSPRARELPRLRLRLLTPSEAWTRWREACRHEWRSLRETIIGERARLRLHTNACGDFTLMSRTAWETVGGYPELEMFSMHIDSLLLYQAHYRGVREVYLPYRLYHIEHAEGFRPDQQAQEDLNQSLERRAIPQLSDAQVLADIIEMYKTKRPKFQNPPTWGFADAALEERRPDQVARADERVVRAR